MILYINTTEKDKIILGLKKEDDFLIKKTVKTKYNESEKLLVEIEKILKNKKIALKDLKKIEIENLSKENTSFTALRIGVVTANALAYGLNIPVVCSKKLKLAFSGRNKKQRFKKKFTNIIQPIYSKDPNITKKKL
jgi:tRNA A37 threonylcarbamoyladenosine modification protein TsaB